MTGPEMRIGDAEREAAVQALGEHFAAGRLTKDEFDERSASAYAARTASALRPLFVDLPGPHPFAAAPRETRTGTPFTGLPWATGPTGATRPAPPARRSGRVPLLPLVLVLVGIAVLLEAPWLVFVGLGVLWLTRSSRRSSWSGCCGTGSKHHTHGSHGSGL